MGIKSTLFRFVPEAWQVPLWYRVQCLTGHAEPEMLRLREFVPPDRAALDVGANIGLYSYALSRICPAVIAFEPQPACLTTLRAMARERNVTVRPEAVSDAPGTLTLRVPLVRGIPSTGLASLRGTNAGGPADSATCQEFRVPLVRLDDLKLPPTGFMKIDVEGHEFEVLRGAKGLLERDRPVLLVEIEQRHLGFPMRDIFAWLDARGYRGRFLQDGVFRSVEEFDTVAHQERWLDDVLAERYHRIRGHYINNFLFLPA